MATELYIRNSDKRLILHKDGTNRYLTGRQVATGQGSTQLYIHAATNNLRWVDNGGVLREAKGVDDGATSQPDGSYWLTSGGHLRFANGGRRYNPYYNRFVNNVSGTTLRVYTNSTRTTQIGSGIAGNGSALNYMGHHDTYYCRLEGSTSIDRHDFTITAHAGYTYTVNGTYTPSTAEYWECNCVPTSPYQSSTCTNTASGCAAHPPGTGCNFEGFICGRDCQYQPGLGAYLVFELICQSTRISAGNPAAFSVTTTEA